MEQSRESFHLVLLGLLVAIAVMALPPQRDAFAQSASSQSAALSESTIKNLQEALSKQGFAVPTTGVLNDETRAAIRRYQSAHHLPVTGEADKATLDKLGVRLSAAQSPTVGQAAPPSTTPTVPGGMMNCPMMQGQMEGMMQMMQGMMKMMTMMQGQMQGMPMQPGAMPPAAK